MGMGLHAMGCDHTICCDTWIAVDIAQHCAPPGCSRPTMMGGCGHLPHSMPVSNVTLSTYAQWEQGRGSLGFFDAACRCLLQHTFCVPGRHPTHCQECWTSVLGLLGLALVPVVHFHALYDEGHLLFECPAMRSVRDRHSALHSQAKILCR